MSELKTGLVQFGDENAGVFITGGEAVYYGFVLKDLLAKFRGERSIATFTPEAMVVNIQKLIDTLVSCNAFADEKAVALKPFDECKT